LDEAYFNLIKLGLTQFMLLNPLSVMIAAMAETYGMWCEEEGLLVILTKPYCYYPYYVAIQVLSSGIAIYMLWMLYYPLKMHPLGSLWPQPRLNQSEDVVWKFFSIKFVIAANFAQEVLFGACTSMNIICSASPHEYTSTATTHALVRMLICVEMIFVAILQSYAFPAQVYTDGSSGVHELRGGELTPLSLKQATYATFDHSDMGKVAADSFRLTNSSVARMPIHVLCNAGGMISEVEIEEVFRQYDDDGRGLIEKREFELMYRHLLRCMIDKAVGEGLPRDEIKALREVAFQPTQVYNTTEAVFQRYATRADDGQFYASHIDFAGFRSLIEEVTTGQFASQSPQLRQIWRTTVAMPEDLLPPPSTKGSINKGVMHPML